MTPRSSGTVNLSQFGPPMCMGSLGWGYRVDLRSAAQAAVLAVPVTWFQMANRTVISRRYSWAPRR